MAITFAASPDGLERDELERLLSGYVRSSADGGQPLLRLVTQRDIETVYAEIAAILETIGASDGGPDIELVSGDLLDCHRARRLRRHRRPGARGARRGTRPPPRRRLRRTGARGTATERAAQPARLHVAHRVGALLRGASGYGDEARMFLRALDEAGLEPIAHRVTPEGPRAELSLDTERLLRRCEQRARCRPRGSAQRPALHAPGRGAAAGLPRLPHDVRDGVDPRRPGRRGSRSLRRRLGADGSSTSRASSAAASTRERLRILPGTIDFDRFHPGAPPVDLGETRDFTFVSNFDFQDRKGWDVLLRAYALEFAGEEDVTLRSRCNTIHTTVERDPRSRGRRARAARACRRRRLPHVRVFDDDIPEAGLPGLYTAADAYVSPTRGEGWGRPADGGRGLRRARRRLALERAPGVPRRRQRHASSTAA